MTPLEILEAIQKDLKEKFTNDPLINRACQIIINEFKIRSK